MYQQLPEKCFRNSNAAPYYTTFTLYMFCIHQFNPSVCIVIGKWCDCLLKVALIFSVFIFQSNTQCNANAEGIISKETC